MSSEGIFLLGRSFEKSSQKESSRDIELKVGKYKSFGDHNSWWHRLYLVYRDISGIKDTKSSAIALGITLITKKLNERLPLRGFVDVRSGLGRIAIEGITDDTYGLVGGFGAGGIYDLGSYGEIELGIRYNVETFSDVEVKGRGRTLGQIGYEHTGFSLGYNYKF
ncbi:MAG: hypothetical protein ACTTH5_05655 [Wolinella sp.]